MKKLVSFAAAFALILGTAGTAAAAILVDDDSDFDRVRSRFNTLTLTNSNSAVLSNVVVSTSLTGDNHILADEDVENGSVTSGDAEAAAEVENVANEIDAEAEFSPAAGVATEEDVTVNDDSEMDDTDTETNTAAEVNANAVSATNAVVTTGVSGGNTVESEDDDVEGGTVESGSASTASSISQAFNILRTRFTWGN